MLTDREAESCAFRIDLELIFLIGESQEQVLDLVLLDSNALINDLYGEEDIAALSIIDLNQAIISILELPLDLSDLDDHVDLFPFWCKFGRVGQEIHDYLEVSPGVAVELREKPLDIIFRK